jgi:PadR family transcriptional regulator PadR
MTDYDDKILNREILLAFWKVHILHHAAEQPIVGNWMLKELRHHGYDASPGTLYPLLNRMAEYGWLSVTTRGKGPRAIREYRLTPAGATVLEVVRRQMRELVGEVPPQPGIRGGDSLK